MKPCRRFLLPLLCGLAGAGFAAADEPSLIRLETVKRDERLMTDVLINGQATRLIVDTGAGAPFVLFAPAAARLHLKLAGPPPGALAPGQVAAQWTAPYDVQWLGPRLSEVSLVVIPPPDSGGPVGFDGLLGWPAFGENLLVFQVSNPKDPIATMAAFPDLPGATQLKLAADTDTLALDFPADHTTRLLVDTGNAGGVFLSPARWREWRAAHPQASLTVQTGYLPAEGWVVEETAWADEIAIGPVMMHDVPVAQAGASYLSHAQHGKEIVVWGLFALKRFDLIVDGRNQRALLVPEDPDRHPRFEHNRIGATFVPTPDGKLKLVAHVLAHAPAAEADVRTGDVLVSVNGEPAAGWWAGDSAGFRAPAGTEYKLELLREGSPIQRRVISRDLLGPKTQPGQKP